MTKKKKEWNLKIHNQKKNDRHVSRRVRIFLNHLDTVVVAQSWKYILLATNFEVLKKYGKRTFFFLPNCVRDCLSTACSSS